MLLCVAQPVPSLHDLVTRMINVASTVEGARRFSSPLVGALFSLICGREQTAALCCSFIRAACSFTKDDSHAMICKSMVSADAVPLLLEQMKGWPSNVVIAKEVCTALKYLLRKSSRQKKRVILAITAIPSGIQLIENARALATSDMDDDGLQVTIDRLLHKIERGIQRRQG